MTLYTRLISGFLKMGRTWHILIPVMSMLWFLSGCGGRAPRPETPTPAQIRAKAWSPYASILNAALSASQSGSELSYAPGDGTQCDDLWTTMVAVAKSTGHDVQVWQTSVLTKVFGQNRGVVYGAESADKTTYMIALELSSCGKVEVLAHELAHLVAVNAGPTWGDPDQREVFMDLVQWGWLNAVGYDSTHPTTAYLSYYVTPGLGKDAAWQDAVLASVAAGVALTQETMLRESRP